MSDPWKLTPREREVMAELIVHGVAKEVARQLGISPRTVEIHVRRVGEKMHESSRVRMAVLYDRFQRGHAA